MRFIGLTLSLFLLISNVFGQVKINIGYSKQIQKEMSQFDRGYPGFHVAVDYGLTNWCCRLWPTSFLCVYWWFCSRGRLSVRIGFRW